MYIIDRRSVTFSLMSSTVFFFFFFFQLSGIKKLEQRLNMILFKMKFPEDLQDIKPVSSY